MSKANIINFFYKLFLIARALMSYTLILAVGIFFFTPCLMLACLPEKYRFKSGLLFWFLDKTYKGICAALMIPITIQGQKNIPNAPAVFVANHQSSLDIPLMGRLMGGRCHLWYVLERYQTTFILGFFVRRLGVFIDQENSGRAARSLLKGIRLVQQHKCHTIIFPEGGRYNDGSVHPFIPGFSVIARKTSYPVVPVFLQSPGKVFPPGSFVAYPFPVTIVVGPPFSFADNDTPESFCLRVHAWFEEQAKNF